MLSPATIEVYKPPLWHKEDTLESNLGNPSTSGLWCADRIITFHHIEAGTILSASKYFPDVGHLCLNSSMYPKLFRNGNFCVLGLTTIFIRINKLRFSWLNVLCISNWMYANVFDFDYRRFDNQMLPKSGESRLNNSTTTNRLLLFFVFEHTTPEVNFRLWSCCNHKAIHRGRGGKD